MLALVPRSVWIVLVSTVAGCAATARSSSYDTLYGEYQRTTPRAYSRSDDDALTGPVLERASYVRAVLRRNPSIESARQGWRAALARTRQAGAFEDPMLELGVAPLSVASSRASLGYQVGISQRLPWFGKRSLDAAVAAAEAEAMKSDFEAMQRELALTALTLYEDYFVAMRALEINAEHIALLTTMRQNAVAQFEAGRGSAQDALQAEAELARMAQDATVLASQRDVTMAQMNELLHRAPELPLPPPPKELARPVVSDVHDRDGLTAEAVRTRPEIAAALHRAQAEHAREERASREYYPDLTLSTSYNSMWEMAQHHWMVGVGLNLPLQTGRRAAAADEARAARAQFQSDAARMTDAARTQVFVAQRQLEESVHVLGLLEQRLLPVARDRIDAARAGFIASQNAFTAVIEAERGLRATALDYQTARADYHKRRAALDRALGRIPGIDWKEATP